MAMEEDKSKKELIEEFERRKKVNLRDGCTCAVYLYINVFAYFAMP